MKAIFVSTILVAFLTAHNASASESGDQLALGGVALAGAAAAGPIGLIVGVTLANHYVTQRNERAEAVHKVAELDAELEATEVELEAERRTSASLVTDLRSLRNANQALADDRKLLSELQFDIHFRTAQSSLSDSDRARLVRLAEVLKRHPELAVELHGYADARGSDVLNDTLAMQRAHAVAAVLTGLDVPQERIAAFAYGERQATATGDDIDGLAYDRRVQVVLDADGEPGNAKQSGINVVSTGTPSTTVAAASGDEGATTLRLKLNDRSAPTSSGGDEPLTPVHAP